MLGLPNGDLAVAGSIDDLARIEFLNSEGTPVWFFDHDASAGGEGATEITDLAPVGTDQLLGIASRGWTPLGFVFLLDLETKEVVWNRYVDEPFVDYPIGPTTYYYLRGPVRVAATSGGHLALVNRAFDWSHIYLTMGLDPLTGDRLWLDAYDSYYQSNGLVGNDAAGWFTHVSSYDFAGAAGYRTRRWSADTGDVVKFPLGPQASGSTPGLNAGEIAIRSDGALVVPTYVYSTVAETLHIITQFPDGSSADAIDVHIGYAPHVPASAVDADDRVYFLVREPVLDDGDDTLLRFNPDASVETLLGPDDLDAPQDIATTAAGGLILLARENPDTVEQIRCGSG